MMPPSIVATSISRANTCASGRNSSVELPSTATSAIAPCTALRAVDTRFPWVISQPFGRPVVPEV
ncbi:Uncharacterised protein [Mycobacterium tuberculosis]|nr:Uncharacterised protein [Mycobacterium tuberculosis]